MKLPAAIENLAERDRRVLLWGAVAAALILVAGGWWTLTSSVSAQQVRIERKQADLAFMQAASAEILAAGPVRTQTARTEPPLVVVDRVAREAGLANQLGGTEAPDATQVNVRFNAAPFDSLVGLMGRLAQQYGLRIERASFEATGSAGLVNASLSVRSATAAR